MRAIICFLTLVLTFAPLRVRAEELKVGDPAPLFSLKNQDGVEFSLIDRKGSGWTVLYFYPAAGTPGCTTEACAFRDTIGKIKALSTEVYGISSDTIEDQKSFHSKHKLSFDLLADVEMKVIRQFDAKMPILSMSKRWTFILDPQLTIRSIQKDVDPAIDAQRVADIIASLQVTAPSL